MTGKVMISLNVEPTPEEKELLRKICVAIGLDLANDVGLLVQPLDKPISFIQLKKSFDLSHFIAFGSLPGDLALAIVAQPLKPLQVGQCHLLFVPALEKVSTDQNIKKGLGPEARFHFR
ncbi:MAG: hypothetical protein AAFU60_09195 [Bacteroidota bacterium]